MGSSRGVRTHPLTAEFARLRKNAREPQIQISDEYLSNLRFVMSSLTTGVKTAARVVTRQFVRPSARFTDIRRCVSCRQLTTSIPRGRQAADDPGFTSIVDNPPVLVRAGKKHGPGLIILGAKFCHTTKISIDIFQP